MLDRNIGLPLRVQLRDLLRDQILNDDLPAHSPLPSERELCEQYSVSRITVRQALAELEHEGLVYAQAGKGRYVAPQLELKLLTGFTDDLLRRGMTPSNRILDVGVVHADDQQSGRLRVPRGAEVVSLYRLRLADGLPVALQLTWLPHHLCSDLLQYDLASRSLFDILHNEYKLRLAHAEMNVRAALAQPEECSLLELSAPAAVLICDQSTCLDDDVVIEFTHSVFRADSYTVRTQI